MQVESSARSGGHASTKDYSLPAGLLEDLRKDETTEALLDRLGLVKLQASTIPDGSAPKKAPTYAFMAALMKEPDVRTENNAPAFSTSDDPLVDLFWDLAPHSQPDQLDKLLDKAWQKAPLDTLRIIWQARSIHEGKGMKDHVFYHLIGYLYRKHPRTLLENLHLLVDKVCKRSDLSVKHEEGVEELVERASFPHGYYKDLLNLLVLGVGGFLAKDVTQESVALALNMGIKDKKASSLFAASGNKKRKLDKPVRDQFCKLKHKKVIALPDWYKTYHVANKDDKHSMLVSLLQHALDNDKVFRALYIVTARIFAKDMKADLPILDVLKTSSSEQRYEVSSRLSLAGKWAPTPGKAHDKHTLISTAIAAVLFPNEANAVNARMSMQTKYLAPLRTALEIAEVKMAAGQWNQINYGRVPSRCMAKNRGNFFVHDEDRFFKYIQDVVGGRRKISGSTLLPHELLIDALGASEDIGKALPFDKLNPEQQQRLLQLNGQVVDAQWDSLVNSLKESSSATLTNCIAVVDVSGSMNRLSGGISKTSPSPIAVAVALGILTAQLSSTDAFKGAFITFSAEPSLQRLAGSTLREIAMNMQQSPWGMNTAFHKVFELILDVAVRNKLKKEDMVQKVFVFSDMQFDQAAKGSWNETTYQKAVKTFAQAGYPLPELVFWNIQGSAGIYGTLPVQADQPGVEMMSGYSGSLLKVFLGQAEKEEEGVLEQKEIAERDEEYDDVDEPVAATTPVARERQTPSQKLQKVLANPAFAELKVVD